MQVRLQPWQFAMMVILVCVAVVGVLVWRRTYEHLTPAEIAAALPKNNGTVVYIDVKALRDAGLIERISPPGVAEDPEYRDFVGQSGFDYRQDLDTVAVELDNAKFFAVLRGRFDWSLLHRYALAHGGTCNHSFCSMPASQKGLFVSYYPVYPGIMAISVEPSGGGAWAISLKNVPKTPPAVPPQAVWVSTTGQTLAGSIAMLPAGSVQFAKSLGAAERVTIAAGAAAARYEITLDATCPTQREAIVLLTELQGLTDMLKKLIAREKQTANPADLSGVLTGGTFRQDGRHVYGYWPVERVFLDAVIGGS